MAEQGSRVAADGVVARLERVRARLADHATSGAHAGLTGADPATGERWEAGQVWAHLAEFPGYWLGQLPAVLRAAAGGAPQPIPFGRTKSDPGRLEPIERERRTDPLVLQARVDGAIRAVESFVQGLSPAEWTVLGLHPTLGPLDMRAMVERFLTAHFEEHADQLDDLAAQAR